MSDNIGKDIVVRTVNVAKHYGEGEAAVRALFENASQGILTADREGRVMDANAMAERLFGYSRAELIGSSVEMLLPESLRREHR